MLFLFGLEKFALNFEFFFIYLCTTQAFPSNIRNMAFGYCNLIGRIGGIGSGKAGALSSLLAVSPNIFIGLYTSTSILSVLCMEEPNNLKETKKFYSTQLKLLN